ncbi:hypothetical protein PLESTB_000755000 [Pleodorina starrii]|uniref:AAA+ ATPase domain-containing protein n=1 Tax=Pleodorina starrii TaxID=330485 RepID=A0A9W6F224_9CHLO|nr:hypothetical protein PLESTM_001570800 [Pleodorina starrii]GLC53487.1 hypothetical protein PLESTB_000755000 [Pleodorina starrii]
MEITPELITQYGLMNKISTGNTFLDVAFCLLVPLLIKHLVPRLAALSLRLWPTKTSEKRFSRSIEYTQRSHYYWYDSDSQPPNSILQRALLNLINGQVQALAELHDADVTIKKKPAAAAGGQEDKGEEGEGGGGGEDEQGNRGGGCSSDGADDDGRGREHAYSFNLVPPSGQWMDLKNGIRFMCETEIQDDKHKSTKIRYRLESRERDGNDRIAAFLNQALEVYRCQQCSRLDPARYLYMPVLSAFRDQPPPVTSGEGDSGSRPSAMYKRYKLSEDKSFASLFHPEKEAITKLVDQFMNKSGKFAIPGYPHKLGFLLYGPPGTGKTSLIKVLAQYTRRSIISVPLSKISTNQELMDIVFDNKLQICNSPDSSISLPFDKTIFVMEDVDAASSVVQRRTPPPPTPPAAADSSSRDHTTPAAAAAVSHSHSQSHPQSQLQAIAEQIAAAKLAAAAAAAVAVRKATGTSRAPSSRDSRSGSGSKDGETSDDQDKGDDGNEEGGGDCGTGQQAGSLASGGSCRRGTAGLGGNSAAGLGVSSSLRGGSLWGSSTSLGVGLDMGPSLPLGALGSKGLGGLFRGDDELNLAGLLNVLDGVVDTPNRIVIMTTNHPDKLDPALVRPGRINKKIYMGRLRLAEAVAMMRHYFGPQGVSSSDEAALRAVWEDERLSPADLEAMCAEYDSPGELVAAVGARLAAGEEGFRDCC